MSHNVHHTTHTAKGVVILTHGLNTHPKLFLPLKNIFNAAGYHVVLVTLSGHESESYAAYTKVKAGDWENDLRNAWETVHDEFPTLKEQVYMCGYSLGGLVELVVAQEKQFRPKAMLLLAPAISPKWYTHAVRSLNVLPGHWALKSYSPEGYGAHPKVPFAAYESLFALWKKLRRIDFSDWKMPAQVWVDPKDELVSLRQVRKFVARHSLEHWEIESLRVKKQDKQNRFHHLIINPDSMHPKQWEFMTQSMVAFIERVDSKASHKLYL